VEDDGCQGVGAGRGARPDPTVVSLQGPSLYELGSLFNGGLEEAGLLSGGCAFRRSTGEKSNSGLPYPQGNAGRVGEEGIEPMREVATNPGQ
jgi:hypothetical protein